MEDDNTMSATAGSSGTSSVRSSVDASLFDDDVFPVRSTTPSLARVPDDLWYMRLLSEWFDAWENVRDLWQARNCRSKLNAMVCFVLLPFRVIRRAASPHNNITIPDHASVCYLFLLMCYAFVINLVDVQKPSIRADVFASSCMVLAIAAMLYVFLFTKDRVHHDPCHDAPIRIFFRAGLYIFGFASILNSICLAYEEDLIWKCYKNYTRPFDNMQPMRTKHQYQSAMTVQVVKALFVVVETLFLGYFHKARLPLDTRFLQISLAHLLGTNLALWIWTLCEETKDSSDSSNHVHYYLNCALNSNCTFNLSKSCDVILDWGKYQTYFYPVFVEYLILALAILYGLWRNLGHGEETLCRFCKNCARCLYQSQNSAPAEENDEEPLSFRQRYVPRCNFGIMFGSIYAAVFLLVMLLAIFKGEIFQDKRERTKEDDPLVKAYCGGSVVMYLSMISACYIILASLRSPNNVQRVRSIDYDDILLYVSLMGILLLEGFHLIRELILRKHPAFHIVAVDITGTVQHLTQVVTLMSLSHYRGATSRRNRVWICECILFLFLTNLAWWIEDSFYLTPDLNRPGEVSHHNRTGTQIDQIDLRTYGSIVKPMVIFFRFHSATYFYNAWAIYRL